MCLGLSVAGSGYAGAAAVVTGWLSRFEHRWAWAERTRISSMGASRGTGRNIQQSFDFASVGGPLTHSCTLLQTAKVRSPRPPSLGIRCLIEPKEEPT